MKKTNKEKRYKKMKYYYSDNSYKENSPIGSIELMYDNEKNNYCVFTDCEEPIKIFEYLNDAEKFCDDYTKYFFDWIVEKRKELEVIEEVEYEENTKTDKIKLSIYKDIKHMCGKLLYYVLIEGKNWHRLNIFLENQIDELNKQIIISKENIDEMRKEETRDILRKRWVDKDLSYQKENGDWIIYVDKKLLIEGDEKYFYKGKNIIKKSEVVLLQEKINELGKNKLIELKKKIDKYFDVELENFYELYLWKIMLTEKKEKLDSVWDSWHYDNAKEDIEYVTECIEKFNVIKNLTTFKMWGEFVTERTFY